MTPNELTAIFGKFAGQELKNPRCASCDTDPVLDAMRQAAADNNLTLRVIFPGGWRDQRAAPNRVNVRIEQTDDNKFIVPNEFYIG